MCFRFRPSELKALAGDARRRQACDDYLDRLNEAVLDAVNASGQAFLSHTKIRERYAIRMTIGNISSDRAEVDRAWRLLRDASSGWRNAPGMALGVKNFMSDDPDFRASWRMFLPIVRLSRQSDRADK